MFEMPLDSLALRELAPRPQWVLWRYETRNGKRTKVPFSAVTGRPASTTKKQNWTTHNNACQEIVNPKNGTGHYDGVGFVFTDEDPYVGIDLDKCISDEGVIEEWALEIITALDSYTEYSPSGKGFHIYIRSKKTSDRCRTGRLEIYSTGRYFTFTGKRYMKTSEKIEARQDEFLKIFNQYLERSETNPAVEISNLDLSVPFDTEKFKGLLSNNPKFKKTWCHERPDLKDQSMSGYDLSLASFAAYADWSDNEIAGLIIAHRNLWGGEEKAQRQDYLIRQIKIARSGMRDGTTEKDLQLNESIEAAKDGDPEKALGVLSEALGISIEKILKRGKEDAHYYFVINGQDILIGKAEHLFSIQVVRNRIFDSLKKMIKKISVKRWVALSDLFECIIEDDLEYTLNRNMETLEMVREYISIKPIWTGEEWNSALPMNQPFEKDWMIWIHARSLLKFLLTNSFFEKAITKPELIRRLREVRFISHVFTHNDEGNTTSRTYWGLKKADLDI